MLTFYEWPTPEVLAHRRWMSKDAAQMLLDAIEEKYGREKSGLACLNFTVDLTCGGGKSLERLAHYETMEAPIKGRTTQHER